VWDEFPAQHRRQQNGKCKWLIRQAAAQGTSTLTKTNHFLQEPGRDVLAEEPMQRLLMRWMLASCTNQSCFSMHQHYWQNISKLVNRRYDKVCQE